MRLKKIVIVLLIPTAAHIIIACCDCIETVAKNYSNKSATTDNLDNSGETPIITTSTSVPKNAYGIKVSFHREIIACNKKILPSFFQSAYATSCDCPPPLEIIAKDSIISFDIFSVYEFDPSHSANSNISEYFKVYTYYSFETIADYLNSMKNYGNSGWTLYDESELDSELILLLMIGPKIHTTNKFRVQIKLSDGRFFEQETEEIDFI